MDLLELDKLVEMGYPRPGLVREKWSDLCGPWDFAFDDDDAGLDESWYQPGTPVFDRTIVVPFPPECRASGIEEPGFHRVVWYRRRVALPPRGDNERVLLHFGAVDYEAKVFVDGVFVGSHRGGHTPCSFDITHAAQGQAETAEIVVRAADDPGDVHQPRGKQDWQEHPHRIWYKRTTGIWQAVWTEVVPRQHIVSLHLVPDMADASVTVHATLSEAAPGGHLHVRLLLDGEVLAEQCQQVADRNPRLVVTVPAFENAWDRPRFEWSPSSPCLIAVEASLEPAGPGTADRVSAYVGMRSVAAADRQFLLNGHPEQLRMVLSQGYWPESHLAAPTASSARQEVELIKALGFNGARLHQKVEDPRFLYWADRLGLMVWAEMPGSGAFSRRAVANLVGEWLEVLERDRGHPCIVAWVVFNESWGLPALVERAEQRSYALGAYHLTRALDPTRLVVSNDGWEHVESDIWGVHDYTGNAEELKHRYREPLTTVLSGSGRWPAARRVLLDGCADRGQPVVLSEFGGVSLVSGHDESWHGYSNAESSDELAHRLGALFAAVHECDGLAGFCYTQFSDTEQESNGLVTAGRQPKVPVDVVRAIVEGRPAGSPPCAAGAGTEVAVQGASRSGGNEQADGDAAV